MLIASTDIQYLKGVGEKRAELLRKKGVDTVGALLRFYPRAYLDWRNITPVAECPFGENVCVRAKIITPVQSQYIRQGMTLFKFVAEDESGEILVTLFNQKFLAEKLNYGCEYLFYGKLGGSLAVREMPSPEIREGAFCGIEPIYPASAGLSSKSIEKLVKTALSLLPEQEEILPESVRKRNGLCGINTAIKNIHFPLETESFERAKQRLVFEELFILQTGLSFLKKRKRGLAGCVITRNLLAEFEKTLSFTLTDAQKRVIGECLTDMSSGRPITILILFA